MIKGVFRKSLAKYYHQWYKDCLKSAEYCTEQNDDIRAKQYLESAEKYKQIIQENKEAIEFFSEGDRAFLNDSTLPEQFRGYR